MSLGYLTTILPPAMKPIEASGSWSYVEDALGTLLPADFKDFIETYGSGTIARFITVLNPFSDRPNLNLLKQSHRQLDALRTLQNQFGEENLFPLYPANGGLLPVAMTDNGDIVHWLTKGDADEWPVVVNEARSPNYQELNCNLTEFLAGILNGSIVCNAFPHVAFNDFAKFLSV